MQPIQVILYMVGLMKFKTQKNLKKKKNKNNFQIEIFRVFADRKFAFFFAFRLHIRTQNWKMAKKQGFRPRVEFSNTLLCIIKIQKRKKLRKI